MDSKPDTAIKLLLASADAEAQEVLQGYFREFRFLLPASLEDLSKTTFLTAPLAIVDYSFSGKRGLEAIKRLKTHRPGLPVIFTTDRCLEERCLKAFKLGARDCFQRPFNLSDMAQTIGLLLSRRPKRDQRRSDLLLEKYAGGRPEPDAIQPKIEKIMRFIQDHFREAVTLSAVAERACMSEYHFSRTFKKQVRMGFAEFLNRLRIAEAGRLLKTDAYSISEICFMVGYNDLTHFERVFRKYQGCCPKTYRDQLLPA